jgi:hypothetical protein
LAEPAGWTDGRTDENLGFAMGVITCSGRREWGIGYPREELVCGVTEINREMLLGVKEEGLRRVGYECGSA